jgi:C4-dicarboxylate transporter DctM subunit
MDGVITGAAILGCMLVLVALRAPATIAMLLPGTVGFLAMTNEATLIETLHSSLQTRIATPELLAFPLFLLMGQFALQGGLAKGLFQALVAFMGHQRRGVFMGSLLASSSFGPMCGSSDAATATITQVAYPELKQRSTLGVRAAGLLAPAGSLGLLLPLSVPLMAYAILTGQALAALFVAALIPGVLAVVAALLSLRLQPGSEPTVPTPTPPAAWATRWRALAAVLPTLLVLALVLAGIGLGHLPPTQAAAWGALGTLLASALQGSLTGKAFVNALLGTVTMCAMVLMVFLAADVLHAALALTDLPKALQRLVLELPMPAWLCLGLLLVGVLALSSMLDELSLLLVALPLVLPVVMGLDLWGLGAREKTLWFGIVMLGTLQIGLLLPPVGRNLHVVRSICRGVPVRELYRGALPFVATGMLRLGLLLVFPSLSLALVRWCCV